MGVCGTGLWIAVIASLSLLAVSVPVSSPEESSSSTPEVFVNDEKLIESPELGQSASGSPTVTVKAFATKPLIFDLGPSDSCVHDGMAEGNPGWTIQLDACSADGSLYGNMKIDGARWCFEPRRETPDQSRLYPCH